MEEVVEQAPRSEWIEGRQAMQTPEDVQADLPRRLATEEPAATAYRTLLAGAVDFLLRRQPGPGPYAGRQVRCRCRMDPAQDTAWLASRVRQAQGPACYQAIRSAWL